MSNLSRPSDHRRKWDRGTYENLASQRIKAELEAADAKTDDSVPVKRDLLKRREYRVDLDSKLGKSVIVSNNTPASQSGGYYCKVCDCVTKDSINYLDHINGANHQKNLGMSMRVERSTLEQVKQRLENNKKKIAEKVPEYDIEQRIVEMENHEEKLKEYRKEKRKEKKRKAHEAFELDDEDDIGNQEMAAMMGFSGFKTGASNKH